jgi:sugar lactone lactonase YvrE
MKTFMAVLLLQAGAGSGIETVAGDGTSGAVGQPFGVEFGPDGALYVCEVENHRLLRWDPATRKVGVVAGTGKRGYSGDGGPATAAQLDEPYEVRFDAAGNIFFVEMKNHLVRRVDARTGIISTVAGTGQAGFSGDGGPGAKAQLRQPHSIALHGDHLYIADIANHRIRRVDLKSGLIGTFAGTGEKTIPKDGQKAAGAPVLGPRALFIQRDTLWLALREGHSVWKLDLRDGIWRHVAGTGKQGFAGDGGPARQAAFNGPKGIALGPDGSIYVVDTENQAIRKIAPDGTISTLAGVGPQGRGYGGDGGPATAARMDRPHGVCVGPDGAVYIGDTNNHRVRRVTQAP